MQRQSYPNGTRCGWDLSAGVSKRRDLSVRNGAAVLTDARRQCNQGELWIDMATADQIKALLRSYAEGDGEQFLTVSMQVAAHAARKGQSRLAQELRELIDEAKRRASQPISLATVPIARPLGELADLIHASYPKTRLVDMILAVPGRQSLARVLTEYRQQDKLPGWPSLAQAGCAAQEIQCIHRIRERCRSRLNVRSQFLVPSAPNFSEAGPPDEPPFPPGWPSLIQAGCAAQEIQDIRRIRE